MRRHLDEHFGSDGPPHEKLRGLLYCLRRHKHPWTTQEEIAETARLTLPKVREIARGDCAYVLPDALLAVLDVLGAGPPEIAAVPADRSPPPGHPDTTGALDEHENRPGPCGGAEAAPAAPADTGPSIDREPGKEDGRSDDHGRPDEIDPMRVDTVQEFTRALEIFRLVRGQRPLREMAKRCLDVNDELKEQGLQIHPYSTASYSTAIKDGKEGKPARKELILTPDQLGRFLARVKAGALDLPAGRG
ncbi:hypothetical protein [Actinomadura fibrosa]|uniref:XRE family transcriptional regulator n=1 Tax=Actinomadura fibrosa TaxID=111802 RepID=A0ABW2XQX1_9ACTN|nr:hypothetical protein [Actinomadura fibrosa]